MWLVPITFCLVALGFSWAQEEVQLDIPQGILKGLKTVTAYHGTPFYSFKGIPYAKPVTGLNKFKISEPAEGWDGVRDATKHGNSCVFFCMVQQKVVGDEDCLFLNVYTPDLNKDARMPVMVYFHPGGFNAGSGDDDLYGPDFLVEKDVILVTVNHRLGAVGFLNTGDANAPGNAGLKDQVLALKWIQGNIKNFGGCPGRVTLFGVSSGGASVQYHMLSPMSTGLFKRAIIQSGTFATSWAFSYTPKENAMRLADQLGLKATDTTDLVQKLSAVPTTDLVAASGEIGKTMTFVNGELYLFIPTVEPDIGQEVFLPTDPWEILKSGKIADVDTMVGITAQEGGLFTPMVLPMASNLQDHFDMFIPVDLNMTDVEQRKAIGDSIKKFYFGDKAIGETTAMELTDLLGDVMFIHGSTLTAKIMNSRLKSPVYQYLFNFQAPFGLMKTLFKLESGVLHGDDMGYLFYSNVFKNKPEPGSRIEKKISEMVEMWTNFAKEGNPSISMDAVKTKWEPMGDNENYLEISDDLTMKTSILQERVNFWASIYKDILGDYIKLFS